MEPNAVPRIVCGLRNLQHESLTSANFVANELEAAASASAHACIAFKVQLICLYMCYTCIYEKHVRLTMKWTFCEKMQMYTYLQAFIKPYVSVEQIGKSVFHGHKKAWFWKVEKKDRMCDQKGLVRNKTR